ncbi:hypothetical protein DFAR_740009 [Desulfarculales bacterium]
MNTDKQPHEVFLEVAADRGTEYPCPKCGKSFKAHDFHELTCLTSIFSNIIAT